jgi:hypothetical protein
VASSPSPAAGREKSRGCRFELAYGLVFERFLSDERRVVPDIDLDFESERREEVIQYIYQTYGPAHVAMACTFVTFRARSAVRDVGWLLYQMSTEPGLQTSSPKYCVESGSK